MSIYMSISSCIGNASFSPEEIRFTAPYHNKSTAIYKSDTGNLIDTIIFSKAQKKITKVRHLEVGFYNVNQIFITYKLSKKSFHRIMLHSIDKLDEPDPFINFMKYSDYSSGEEIDFLGLIFGKEYIDKCIETKKDIITFDEKDASHSGININKGIKSFKYSVKKGVTSFIDDDGIEWKKIN